MKEGGVKKTKKQPTTKTQTKPLVLIKHRVDSNPAKGKKAPDLMRESSGEEQNSPQSFLQPSHPTGISTSSSLWEQKIIRCCVKQSPLLLLPLCFPNKPREGALGARDGMVSPSRDGEGFWKSGLSQIILMIPAF